jgi:hypothetical protein
VSTASDRRRPVADSSIVSTDDRQRQPQPGDIIVLADVVGTAAFVITALTAAIVFSTPAQWVGAITAMALFTVGVFAFLWSFYNAVQRSRTDQIGVLQMYLLLGSPTPPRVRRWMLGALVVQVAVGLGTAIGRSEAEDGSPGTSLAVGILVPMFGIGLNGLWCAFHGTFPPRADVVAADHGDGDESTTNDGSVGHNGDHG